MREALGRVRFLFKDSNAWQSGYDRGYAVGLEEGADFGKRIAYNTTLSSEIPDILQRYDVQLKKHLPKDQRATELGTFIANEVDRLKMELQR